MDNVIQLHEIKRYCSYLCLLTGKKISLNLAAEIWIRKYAAIWRKKHPVHIAMKKH